MAEINLLPESGALKFARGDEFNLELEIKDRESGDLIDITNATITLEMKDNTSTIFAELTAVIDDGPNGLCHWVLTDAETDTDLTLSYRMRIELGTSLQTFQYGQVQIV